MSPVVKSVLSLVVLCAAALLGTCSVHSAREKRHLHRLLPRVKLLRQHSLLPRAGLTEPLRLLFPQMLSFPVKC